MVVLNPIGVSPDMVVLKPREPGLESPASMENPWTNPGFLETQISAKSQGMKTLWPGSSFKSAQGLHGKSMDKSRVFGYPDFGKKSRFENKLVRFF